MAATSSELQDLNHHHQLWDALRHRTPSKRLDYVTEDACVTSSQRLMSDLRMSVCVRARV